MYRIRSSRVVLVLAVLVTGACGGGEVEAHTSAEGADRTGARAVESRDSDRGGSGEFRITLDGPPHQGTHRYSGDLQCMMFGGIWQAHFELPEERGMSAMMVQLKEVPATGGSTDQLMLSVTFGQMDDATLAMVDVHGAEYGRDGRGEITREGNGAVIRVQGTTHNGTRVTADLRCATVDFM